MTQRTVKCSFSPASSGTEAADSSFASRKRSDNHHADAPPPLNETVPRPAAPPIDQQTAEATEWLLGQVKPSARIGLILGTGMGHLAESLTIDTAIPYGRIPHFPRATAPGHRGRLVFGWLAGAGVVALDGRFHRYEGYTAETIGLPVRVLRRWGVDLLILTNASGGLNPQMRTGQIVVVEDHINLQSGPPPAGPVERELLPVPCPSIRPAPYDRALIEQVLAIARRENFIAHRGVYAAMNGPCYETRAEYRMLRRLGADVVGMSTVPEVTVAALCGMRVLALSVVTNQARPDAPEHVTAEKVLADASTAEPHVRAIVTDLLRRAPVR